MNRLQQLLDRWRASFPGRTWARYSAARGNVLAGGIAYFAFFSIFPALALGFTALALVLGDDNGLQRELADYVNRSLGSDVIGLGPDDPGAIVSLDTLIRSSSLTFGAVAGLAVLVFTGLGWLDAVRQGIRAVFGVPGGGNPVIGKLRDLGALLTFGLAVLVSAVAGVVVSAASTAVLDWIGLDGRSIVQVLVRVASTLVLLVVDTGIFLVLFRWLPGVRVPVRQLWQGALVGGIALGLLKVFGGVLLNRVGGNGFYAAFAVVVGLLVWMNLVGRLTLLAASWSATLAADAGHLPQNVPQGVPANSASASPATDGSSRARPDRPAATAPSYGVRAADRTTLAAGVVLGLFGAYALRVGRGAVRAVTDVVRG